ncbi:MAG TPA: ethanolamine ammonia-lyase subunit EutC [Rectinemataceae bacterium]|nr:ethanolamine ammonia-lyase subunit EutC [Rectinemataceae bacterium]
MDDKSFQALIDALVRELEAPAAATAGAAPSAPTRPAAAPGTAAPGTAAPNRPASAAPGAAATAPAQPAAAASRAHNAPPAERAAIELDLGDLGDQARRRSPGLRNAVDPEGLAALVASTSARLGGGRAGPRLRTRDYLVFRSDLAVSKDALGRDVDPALLEEFGLFAVQTRVEGGLDEYLLRPDLGRRLGEEAAKTIAERCVKKPDIQLCVGDGLSARAIEANLRKIFPVIRAGCEAAGLGMGTPFFIRRCRVGVMNDIGDLLEPRVLILLIGERPGLGRADSMSAYMAYRPRTGHTDADRDVICNIYDGGGTNPLEAGAYALRLAQKMIERGASGVKLRLQGE